MPAKKVVSLVSFASWLGALLAELRSEVISSGGKKVLERARAQNITLFSP